MAVRLGPLLLAGDVATCGVIELEILFSAKNHAELVRTRSRRRSLPHVETMQLDFDRAVDVLEGLARSGHHRAAKIPDLLIAAVAKRHGLSVLHYDRDFELIARVTGQRTEWVVPPGTVP